MPKKKEIQIEEIDFINTVMAYNKTKQRFQYDCKMYEKGGKWYWLWNDTYVRDVYKDELDDMNQYFERI